jgi:hypothetical protein
MNTPFFSLTDSVLDDLSQRVNDLGPWVCPDVKAKLRAAVADLPKGRQRLRDFIECNDANGERFALVPFFGAQMRRVDDAVWHEVYCQFARRFGLKCWSEIQHDPETDIISAGDRILGCLSTVKE